jgi:hypothetical protein
VLLLLVVLDFELLHELLTQVEHLLDEGELLLVHRVRLVASCFDLLPKVLVVLTCSADDFALQLFYFVFESVLLLVEPQNQIVRPVELLSHIILVFEHIALHNRHIDCGARVQVRVLLVHVCHRLLCLNF